MKLTHALVSLAAAGAVAATIALGLGAPKPGPTGSSRAPLACDLDRGPCARTLADGTSVVFELSPRPVHSMAALEISARVTRGSEAVDGLEASVGFEMPGMFMGPNRVALPWRGHGVYSAPGTLVRCQSGGKTWRADLQFLADAGTLAPTSFEFQVDEH